VGDEAHEVPPGGKKRERREEGRVSPQDFASMILRVLAGFAIGSSIALIFFGITRKCFFFFVFIWWHTWYFFLKIVCLVFGNVHLYPRFGGSTQNNTNKNMVKNKKKSVKNFIKFLKNLIN
jgi:hypothetical protein